MRLDFKDSVHWDELAEIYGNILRVAGYGGVAKFMEMWYLEK